MISARDLVALLVIALGYTEHVSVTALAVAAGLFAGLFGLRWAGSWRGPAAALLGIAIWFAMFESGVDPVIAGLATSSAAPSSRARSASSRRPSSPTPRARASPRRSRPTSACSTACTRGRAG